MALLGGRGMTLLEEVCHCGGGLWGLICSSCAQCGTISFLLPVDQNVELSAPSPAPCLPVQCHVSCHDDNGPDLWTVSQLHLIVFLYKSCLYSWCFFTAIEILRQWHLPPSSTWGVQVLHVLISIWCHHYFSVSHSDGHRVVLYCCCSWVAGDV